jgi:hypothetical protein
MPALPIKEPQTQNKQPLNMVQGGGFEPPKLARQIYSLIPLATREPLRLIFCPRSLLGLSNIWSWREESNPRPADYKSAALPTELHQHIAKLGLTTIQYLASNVEAGF